MDKQAVPQDASATYGGQRRLVYAVDEVGRYEGVQSSGWEAESFCTELAVTDRRVIFKTGFVRRRTVEMNMDKVETVDVDQSILGRILGYGTIHVLGTGSGIEHLRQVAHPLELRSAITAK